MSAQQHPRSDHVLHREPGQSGTLEFKKQPVSAAPGSDSEAVSSSDGNELSRPLSLLTSLLASPKSGEPGKRSDYHSALSASSSPPSTAFGSPRMKEEPVSILRRGSISDGEAFHLPTAKLASTTPDEVRVLSSPPRPALKFAVATRNSPHKPRCVADFLDSDDAMDPGYEEDSEEGLSDAEEDEPAFLMHSRNLALEKALSLLENRTKSPPPPRIYRPSDETAETRGRGHVRVDPSAVQNHSSCSRHCSPPPAEPEPLRPALPGPREGRAGSPIPTQGILSDLDDDEDDDDDDDDDEDDDGEEERTENGSHNAAPQAREDVHEQSALASDSSDEEPRGLRQMLRRASEHIPAFRRRSFGWTIGDNGTTRSPMEPMSAGGGNVLRARSLSTGPIRIGASNTALELRSQPLPCPGRSYVRTDS